MPSRRFWQNVFLPAFLALALAAIVSSLIPVPGSGVAASAFVLLAAGLYIRLLQRYWEETGDVLAEAHRFRQVVWLTTALLISNLIFRNLSSHTELYHWLILAALPVFATYLFVLLTLLLELLRLSPTDWRKRGLLIFTLAFIAFTLLFPLLGAIQFLVFFLLAAWALNFEECSAIPRGQKIIIGLVCLMALIFIIINIGGKPVEVTTAGEKTDQYTLFVNGLAPIYHGLITTLKQLVAALLILLPLKLLFHPIAEWLRSSLRIRTKLMISYVFSSVIPLLLLAVILFFGFLFTMGSFYQRFITQLISTRSAALLEKLDLRSDLSPVAPGNRLVQRMEEEGISAALFETGHEPGRGAAYYVQTPFQEIRMADSSLARLGRDRFNGLFLSDTSLYLTQWAGSGDWTIGVFRQFTQSDLMMLKAQCGLDLTVYPVGKADIRVGGMSIQFKGGEGTPAAVMRTDSVSETQHGWTLASLPILIPGLTYDSDGQVTQSYVLFTIRISLKSLFGSLFSSEYIINQAYLILFAALAVILGAVLVLVAMIGFGLAGGITHSISLLRKGTQQISRGDLSTRIHIKSRDELSQLAGSFNSMVADLERMLKEIKEKERLEGELEAARAIQMKLLPQDPPTIPGYRIAATSLPAKQVGGDYYDFLPGKAGRLELVVGDVSGKGMPAALLMANLQASLHTLAESGLEVQDLISRLNRVLYANTDPQIFATFFFGVLDPAIGKLVYVNAGHNPPVVCGNGRLEQLSAGGLPLGVMQDSPYMPGQITLKPGELVALYSDGIVEAADDHDREFGEARFIELLRKHSGEDPETILSVVLAEVAAFCGTPQDDVTLVVVKRI